MAEIRAFRALRYNISKVKLADVLTQPYDKINPSMQGTYYECSPFNLIRFELGKTSEQDNDSANVYTRALAFLGDLEKQGVLVRDDAPSIYAYSQRYEHPTIKGTWLERRAFIALGQLHEYTDKVVFRHEQTLSKPKNDRMNVLKTTRTHSGQIFMLYDDPQQRAEKAIWDFVGSKTPDAEVVDEYKVENKLWKISDSAVIDAVVAAMKDKQLIIADGHHRYETSLAYRTAQCSTGQPAGHDYTMMSFVNMRSEGLVVLPTHRVLFGLGMTPEQIIERISKVATVQAAKTADANSVGAELNAAADPSTFAAVLKNGKGYLITPKKEIVSTVLAESSADERKLDVLQLHAVVLESALGLSSESIREQRNIRYYRSAVESVADISKDADAAFLLRPVSLDLMKSISLSGRVMPQKSTDFYPKLLSGIALYSLDRGF